MNKRTSEESQHVQCLSKSTIETEAVSETMLLFNLFYLFICLVDFGCVESSLLRVGFSLVEASRGYSSSWCAGFSLQWLLLLQSTGSRHTGFSSCGARAQQLRFAGSRAQCQ